MIDAKFFDQDEIVRFGQPFHGLYRGGVLTLPTSVTITPPPPLPVGSDGFMVKIPDRPVVTTSPADAAEGMEWLNYAIVSGENHVFYGIELGLNSWIYVADDDSAWRAEATISPSGTASVVLTNINDTTQTQTVTASCAPAPGSGTFSGKIVQFEDVSTDGRSACFCWRDPDYWYPPANPYVPWEADPRYTRGLFIACHARLDISGVPPSASAEFVLVMTSGTESGVARRYATIVDTLEFINHYDPENPELLVSVTGAGIVEETEVCAMMFDADNVLLPVVKRRWTITSDYVYDVFANTYAGTRSVRRRLEYGSVVTSTLQSDYAWSGSDPVEQITTSGWWQQWGDGAIRYSNKCYGLYELSTGGSYRFGAFISFASVLSGWVSTGSGWTPVAAAHPESGAITSFDSGSAAFF